MRHVFRATKMGWDEEKEGIWFDTDRYPTREQAEEEFKPYQDTTREGYPYTAYEYDGERYHDYQYLGLFEDDKMPRNDNEYIDSLLHRR